MPVFYHEKLPVYRQAQRFAVLADRIACRLPRERWSLKDQLWRASASILLNIAEGTAGQTDAGRIHYLRIARGSAAECSAIFDYIAALQLIPAADLPYQEIRSIGAQLGTAIYKHL